MDHTSIIYTRINHLGFLAFLTILTIGFWLFFVLLLFVIPYWVFGALKERIEEFIEERKK